jgi:hypothetical protein
LHGRDATEELPLICLGVSGVFLYVGENIIFGMSNGNIKLRRSPQGDEVEVSEATLAGAMIDLFFTDKFEGQYDTVSAPKKSA